jgi:RNA polymerase sigma-70 factor (ECF subfamily)
MGTIATTLTDEPALLAAARAGDERAFRALVEPHRRVVEVHCYRMLGSLADAEDVTQETLLRAWRSLERFERRSSVSTWLYRIATNACLDQLDREGRRPQPLVDPYPDERLAELPSPIADPAARYARREGLELAFLTAIQRLPGRQRAVLILRDVLGLTGQETAELLESTVAAVNSALQRARATIDGVVPSRSLPVAPTAERDLLRRYVEAWERDDVDGLVALLREDAVLSMPPQPSVVGAVEIGGFFTTVRRRHGPLTARATWANGQPAVSILERRPDGTVGAHRLLVLDTDGARVAVLHAFSGPATLAAFMG